MGNAHKVGFLTSQNQVCPKQQRLDGVFTPQFCALLVGKLRLVEGTQSHLHWC